MKLKNLGITKAFARYGAAFLAVGLLAAACGTDKPKGYTISGSVEGAVDGDSVFLEIMSARELKQVAATVIADGTFKFEGQPDTTTVYYISCATQTTAFSTPIFLDGGNISVRLADADETITGTPANDAYQEVRGKINDVRRRMIALDADSTLTEEEKSLRFDPLDTEYIAAFKEGAKKNITNRVGIFLFKQRYWENTLAENLELLAKVPAAYQEDPEIQGIRAMLAQQEKTDVSKPYTDLELQTPEGKTVRLSDFVGKGKPVLVDFWASWCGPCRASMPELKALYAKHKGKFEIVGISLDTDLEAWKKSMQTLGITWPQMSDLKGWSSIAAKEYGINSIPHTILIDKDGMIVARQLEGENLEENLVNLF